MTEKAKISVLGSFMTDVTSYVRRLPQPGETICGHKLVICCGGKGANQCVTAARLGASTAMIGKLGDDSFGHSYLKELEKEGVDKSHVSLTNEALTGVAQIIVEDSGQNNIVIVSGANNHLSPKDVLASRDLLSGTKVLMSVLEIPEETVLTGLRLANELNILTILNAAPAMPTLQPEFYALSDIFCVNETEAEILTSFPVSSNDEAVAAAQCLMAKGCKNHVLITLGSQGALLLSKDHAKGPVFVQAPVVQALDTTGAGDCFLGALAYFLAYHEDLPLEKAISNACKVASISVQRAGTQPSFPRKDELDPSMFA